MLEFQDLQPSRILLLPKSFGYRKLVRSSRNCLISILPSPELQLQLQIQLQIHLQLRHFERMHMGTAGLEHRLGKERIRNNKDCRQD